MIELLAPFLIYGFFLQVSSDTSNEANNEQALDYAFVFTIVIGILSYFLTKNIYLSLAIVMLGFALNMVL